MSITGEQKAFLTLFGREIYVQALALLQAHQRVIDTLHSPEHRLPAAPAVLSLGISHHEGLRLHLEAVILHAANLSRILFSDTTPERAAFLRAEFGVAADAVLKERTLRNAFQHQDERLDKVAQRLAGFTSTLPSPFNITYMWMNSLGQFKVQWHNGVMTQQQAAALIVEVRQLERAVAERMGYRLPYPDEGIPLVPPAVPEGWVQVFTAEIGSQVISDADYRAMTGQPPKEN